MTTKLPAKFEICTKYNRTSRYVLTLDAQGYYEMAPAERSLDDAYDVLKKYSQGFVKEAVQGGMWEITKDMDEPELVFPFTVEHHITNDLYDITKGSQQGRVTMADTHGMYANEYSEDDAKQFIKDGIWIVKHVGEKLPEVVTSTTYLSAADLDKISIKCGTIEAKSISVGSVQAPQSAPLSSLSLTITADTDAAVEAVGRLTASYEALAITLGSVIALYKELKEVA